MSIQAKLYIDDQVFNLKRFSFGFTQNTNHYGLPCSAPKQKGVMASINMVKDSIFEEWAVADRMKKDIEIHMIHNILGQGRTRVLKCYDCFLVHFDTDYAAYSTEVATNNLMFMCGAIEASWSTTIFVEDAWGKMPDNSEPTTVIEEEELQIIDTYYTDLEGNEVAEPEVGDEVYLVIHSENGIGETTDIDLSNQTKDFIYNGQVLENDILNDYLINSNEDKVKLRVVAQQEGEHETLQS